MTRTTSSALNGFASTSQAPRFRASAHKHSSANREVTIKRGGSGRSEIWSNIPLQVPDVISQSQMTIGRDIFRNKERAAATVALAVTVQRDWKMRSRAAQSS